MICPVCNENSWGVVYDGLVRHGSTEVLRKLLRCNKCGIERLNQFYNAKSYETGAYRELLGEHEWDYEFHDTVQKHIISELPTMRGKVVVDVGCGRGSFLNMVAGQALKIVGVEPNVKYHDVPYEVYSYATDVPQGIGDMVVSFDVIEHTDDPVAFMCDVGRLLAPNGRMFVVTPNTNEILFKLLPEFKRFKYQTVHNWYFTDKTLELCAKAAGLAVESVRTIHRHGIGNTLGWLLEKKPVGDKKYEFLTEPFDAMWRACLNREGLGEALLIECRRRDDEESRNSRLYLEPGFSAIH